MAEEEKKALIPPQAVKAAEKAACETAPASVATGIPKEILEMEFDPRIMQKMNLLRQEVVKLNWVPDGIMTVQGRSVSYITINKVKANLAPVLAKVGVELNLFYDAPEKLPGIGNMTQQWKVVLYGRFIDCESGASVLTRTYGVSADSGDKGLKKAHTSALGVWLYSQFLLADFTDSADNEEDVPVFRMKNPQEVEECRSKIQEHAVKPATPAKPAKPAVKLKEVPKAAEAQKEPEVAQKAPEAPATADAPKAEEKVEEKKEETGTMNAPKSDFKPSAIQQRAIDKIVGEWTQAAQEGRISAEAFNKMSVSCASMSSKAEATKFIENFREVKE